MEVIDYVQITEVMPFTSCQRARCIGITIVDDLALEDDESFNVSLERNGLDDSIRLEPTTGQTHVIDNDG